MQICSLGKFWLEFAFINAWRLADIPLAPATFSYLGNLCVQVNALIAFLLVAYRVKQLFIFSGFVIGIFKVQSFFSNRQA